MELNQTNKQHQTKILTDFKIRKLINIKSEEYFLVIDNTDKTENNGYFCFNNSPAWHFINQNYEETSEWIGINYEEREIRDKINRRIVKAFAVPGVPGNE